MRRQKPLLIALIYMLFSTLWITISDLVLASLVTDADTLTQIQTFKGLFFITISGIIIYLLVRLGYSSQVESSNAFDSLHIFSGLIDLKGKLIKANKTSLRFIGAHPRDVIGKLFWETPWWTHDLKIQQKLKQEIAKALKGEFIRFETTHQGRDGSMMYVDFTLKPLRNRHGKVIAIIPEGRDITPIKYKDIRYQTLFQNAGDGIILLDRHRIVDCNSRATELFDCDRDFLLTQTPYGLSPRTQSDGQDSQTKAMHLISQIINTKGNITFEWQHRTAKGKVFDADVNLAPIDVGDKTIVQAVIRDQSEIKKTEEELARSQRIMNAAINSSPAGFLLADAPNVVIRQANMAALQIRGDTKEQLLNINVEEHAKKWRLFHPDGTLCEPEDLPLSRAVQKGVTTSNEEYYILREDGQKRWILANAAPIYNKKNKIAHGVVVFLDITDIKEAEIKREQMESQLAQSQKMDAIGTLAGGIAHDFNNILTGIFGHIQMAGRHIDDEKKVKHRLDKVREAANRAGQLVRQILTFSRKEETVKKSIDLVTVVTEAYELLRASIPSTIKLVLSLKTQTAMVNASATQIHQVIMNLVTNAYHAIGDGAGRIIIRLTEKEGMACLEVEDDGKGIPESMIKKIFDPYFTTKEQGHGVGLGLSLVHGIIVDHQGTINIESAANIGTTFIVEIPLINEVEDDHKSEIFDNTDGNNELILLVEDEDDIRNVLAEFLQDIGYQVDAFADPKEAFSSFIQKREEYRLVITDMTMPNMLGTELSEKIIRHRYDLPIILCSGYSPMVTKEVIKQIGIKEFVEKPVDIEKLAQIIRKNIS